MKSYLVDVRIAGSLEHVVAGKRATVPEIALLRLLHGAENVSNVCAPEDVADYIEHEEHERLSSLYDSRARDDGQPSRMERLFGVGGNLPTTLKGIGIDAKVSAREAKAAAEAAAARAAELQAEVDAEDQDGGEDDETKLFE